MSNEKNKATNCTAPTTYSWITTEYAPKSVYPTILINHELNVPEE